MEKVTHGAMETADYTYGGPSVGYQYSSGWGIPRAERIWDDESKDLEKSVPGLQNALNNDWL